VAQQIDFKAFQQVSYVTGDVSADGSAILLRVETEHDGHVDLSFATVDLQHLVTLLLILGGKAAVRGRFAAFSETFQAQPLPLHGVSLGLEENEGVLTIEVGATVVLAVARQHGRDRPRHPEAGVRAFLNVAA
jgi:hypothetical protein